ncbi:MAG: SH3 domain-containing protein [Thiotrichaceae bacterium]|nr:SH3 domain-containing protein [Thiotrichaceae bacterium]
MYKLGLLVSLILVSAPLVVANAESQDNVFKVSNVRSHGVLNVRAKPSVRSNVLFQLPSDSRWVLKRTVKKGKWQKVIWGKKEGWVYTDYLAIDHEGSLFLKNHRQCVKNNPTKAICCGYEQPHGRNLAEIKTYKVVNVSIGQSLNVRSSASPKASKVSTMPHNAIGIVKDPRGRMKIGHSTWQKIRWNGHDGWVNSHYINYDAATSNYRNFVKKSCAK